MKMKQTKKTLKSMVLSVLCLVMLFTMLAPATVAKADAQATEIAYKKSITLSAGNEYLITLTDKALDGKTVTDVKANKNNVEAFPIENGFFCYVEKTGKITFTMTLSASGKKDVKKKCTIDFIKYVNPLKQTSFITSEEISQFKLCSYAWRPIPKKLKETVKFSAKKGWTIVSIRFDYLTYVNEKGKNKTVKVKNNASFTYPKNFLSGLFVVKVKNTKTGFTETMRLCISGF